MEKVTEEDFNLAVQDVISELQELFKQKNGNYKSGSDPMANFTLGGLIRHGDGSMVGRYECLKDYVTKHIANAMDHDINFPGLQESTRDIAMYFVIATAMARLLRKNDLIKMPTKNVTDGFFGKGKL